jgi:hypothetical protein
MTSDQTTGTRAFSAEEDAEILAFLENEEPVTGPSRPPAAEAPKTATRTAAAPPPAQPRTPAASANGAAEETLVGQGGLFDEAEDEDEDLVELDPSDLKLEWPEGWHYCEVMSYEPHLARSGNKSKKVELKCLAGPNKGNYRDEYFPIEGGGVVKTYRFAEAIGLRDAETGKVRMRRETAVGKRLWVEVVPEKQKWERADGTEVESIKFVIRFPDGYREPGFREVPAAGDKFA